jgi:hypothetical protein
VARSPCACTCGVNGPPWPLISTIAVTRHAICH